MSTRIGVDVGGTFTDLIFYDDQTGEIRVGKEPTTPAAPEEGVIAAVAAAVPAERVGASEYFLHGTTVGLNSLLTRTGAVVGLLATRGFRDILEIRRGDRDDPYDLFWKHPPPLVPRRLRIPVTERMYFDGTVHTAIDLDDVRNAAPVFTEEGVDERRDRVPARVREPGPRARRRGGAPRGRLRGRDLALAPGLGRVPGVRAHDHDGHRRLRAPAHGRLPEGARRPPRGERLRRASCS